MSEGPHFSKRTLEFGAPISRTRLGRIITQPFTGSGSPNEIRAAWYANVHAEAEQWVSVPGDPNAGGWPRGWLNAMVMSTTEEEVQDLDDTYRRSDAREAVAYRSEEIVHVGIHPNQVALFGRLRKERFLDEWAAGMRIGRGPLEASMGVWLPGEEAFIGASVLKLVHKEVHVNQFGPLSQTLSRVPVIT